MRRALVVAFWLVALILICAPGASAAPAILSKEATGPILPDHLELVLQPTTCDATADLIPPGSRLVSEQFTLREDDRQVGLFAGVVRVVAPDGHIVFRAALHGTAGIGTSADACLQPGHLEGRLNPLVATPMVRAGSSPQSGTAGADALDLSGPVAEIAFIADLVPQEPGSVYKGRLAGLFTPPPPPPPSITVNPERPQYRIFDPLVAIVANHSGHTIQAADGKSACTIVWLQMMADKQWTTVEECRLERATTFVDIPAGETRRVVLPGADPAGNNLREPGLYRFTFEYQLLDASGAPEGGTLTAVSPPFTVAGVTPPPGDVTLVPEKLEYRTDEPVVALVANKSDKTVASIPVRSYCTIVSLQRRVDGGWQPEGTCAYVRAPDPVFLGPNSVTRISLPPGGDVKHVPGTYRLVTEVLPIGPDGAPVLTDPREVVSPLFQVVGTTPPPPNVTVAVARPSFLLTEPIEAVVTNASAQPIQAYAFYSYCTILTLERQVENGWVPAAMCMLDGGPSITVPAGQSLPVLLPPSGGKPALEQAGTYRLVLQYHVVNSSTGDPAGDTQTAVSAPFAVVTGTPPAYVAIKPDKPSYSVTDTITALIQNGAVPVRLRDGQSLCTVVRLQVAVDGFWKTLAPCPDGYTPKAITLSAGESLSVPLTRNATWDPGKYRLAITYRALDASGSPIGAELVSWTDPFPVGMDMPSATLNLSPDKTAYSTTEPITAILENGPARIRIYDEKSFCTIVRLQRAEAGRWVLVEPCPLARMPIPVILEPGQRQTVTLPPAGTTAPSWTPGTYRLAVAFAPVDANGHETGPDQFVATLPFSVGSTPAPDPLVTVKPVLPDAAGRLSALITNGTPSPIQTLDQQSFCGILTLELTDGTTWNPVAPCPMMGMAHPYTLQPGETVSVALPSDASSATLGPGAYRLHFYYYSLDGIGRPVPPRVDVFSDPFRVGAAISAGPAPLKRRATPPSILSR